ncbi:MAG TPA: hypothetical protein VGJ84_24100 [Polyangiaceae bacterium]
MKRSTILVILGIAAAFSLGVGCGNEDESTEYGTGGATGAGGSTGTGGATSGCATGRTCDNFCTEFMSVCASVNMFASQAACVSACTTLSQTNQTAICCRDQHLGYAVSMMDTATHCPHAAGQSVCM